MGDEEKKEKKEKKKSKKKAEAQETEAAAPQADDAPAEPAPAAASESEPPVQEEEAAPPPAAPPAAAPPQRPSTKKKAQRCQSNIFAMFTERLIREFKEAFEVIDQDKDGFISKSDLKLTFDLLGNYVYGREIEDEDLESMLAEAPGPLNFTMFLTIFGERISGTDEEDVILSAFSIFDEGDGRMKEEVLKNTLRKRGDRFSDEEAEICLKEAPVDKEGYISIRRFTKVLVKGDDDEDPGE